MTTLTHAPAKAAKPRRRRHAGRSPLAAPLLLLAAVTLFAVVYVAYVLWPRWPDAPTTLSAPFIPIIVAGVPFNIEPAAIRMPVLRRPGTQERIDLAYLWPSLTPPDPTFRRTLGAPVDPNERLFVTIASGDGTPPGRTGSRCAASATARPIRARSWCSSRPRPRISWRAARARASPIPVPVCWSGASAMPTSRCVFRATGSATGKASPPASTS